MLRMGALVHGIKFVHTLDGAMTQLGPDTSLLEDILGPLGRRHQRHGVKREHFAFLEDAVKGAISAIIGDAYNNCDKGQKVLGVWH